VKFENEVIHFKWERYADGQVSDKPIS